MNRYRSKKLSTRKLIASFIQRVIKHGVFIAINTGLNKRLHLKEIIHQMSLESTRFQFPFKLQK